MTALHDAIAEKRPSDIPIVVLDTETTGLHPGLGHRVVEIGAVRLEQGRITAELNQQLFPERHMDPAASAVNSITDDDLIGMPLFGDIVPELLNLLDGALIVAHNAAFDAAFLAMELHLCGCPPTDPDLLLPNPWLCTLLLARKLFYFDSNSLGSLARHFQVRTGTAHRAINDAHTTAEVLKRMMIELRQHRLHTIGDLLHAQGAPIYASLPPAPEFLPAAATNALANGRCLRIRYLSTDNKETERIVTPKYFTQHAGIDYLVAFCHLREEQRTFRIDRILHAEMLPEKC